VTATEADAVERVVASARPHPLAEHVPPALAGVLLEMAWEQHRLWSVDHDPVPARVSELRWHLELPWWRAPDGACFRIRPVDVLARPDRFPEHDARIGACDLRFPVHAVRRRGRLVVLDGIHRLARAERERRSHVDTIVLTADDLAAIASPEPSTPARTRGNLSR
jgi:hypothetical protein